MTEILWHGRGGQGAFTAARLLGAAYALKSENNYALSFPSFGPERRGAPIRAFTKLDEKPIGNRSEIKKADISVFLDDTLFSESAFEELKDGGVILLNTKKPVSDKRVLAFDANEIAERILKLPVANTVMLGAISAVFPKISAEDIENAVYLGMPEKLQKKNAEAVREAARLVGKELKNEAVS